MRTPHITALTMLGLMVKTAKMRPEELATRAGFAEPEILDRILGGEEELTIKRAAAIARACGRHPAFLVGLTVAHNHPELWSDLQGFPHALLDYQERVLVKTYWQVSPRGKKRITPARRRRILEALGMRPSEMLNLDDEV